MATVDLGEPYFADDLQEQFERFKVQKCLERQGPVYEGEFRQIEEFIEFLEDRRGDQ